MVVNGFCRHALFGTSNALSPLLARWYFAQQEVTRMDTPLIASPDVSLASTAQAPASFKILSFPHRQRRKLASAQAPERRWDPMF